MIAKNVTARGSPRIQPVRDVIQVNKLVMSDVTVDVIPEISGGVASANTGTPIKNFNIAYLLYLIKAFILSNIINIMLKTINNNGTESKTLFAKPFHNVIIHIAQDVTALTIQIPSFNKAFNS